MARKSPLRGTTTLRSMDTGISTESLNGTDNNSGESSLSKKSRKRGPTVGNFFEKEDQIITLGTNEYGIPNENSKDRSTFVSTIGVLARTHLPITYKSFPEMPEVFKKKVVDTLSECYKFEGINGINVDFVTHIMKECWRGHKNNLYVKYIKDRDPLVVKESPAPFNVPIEDWRTFVDYCNTTEFKVFSERNQKNRKKMIAPATLGRKPIVVLRHEMAVEKNLGSDSKVARPDVYLKCHTKKDGSLLCSSVASNIKKIEHADPSSRVLSINDSLTQALGKDKGGRMRGLSGCLSRTLLKKATPLVEKNKSLEAEKSIMTNEVMELKENYKHVTQVIAELKETIVANKQGGNTLSTRKPFSPLAELDNIVGKQCILYGWGRRLIAHGLIQSTDPNWLSMERLLEVEILSSLSLKLLTLHAGCGCLTAFMTTLVKLVWGVLLSGRNILLK